MTFVSTLVAELFDGLVDAMSTIPGPALRRQAEAVRSVVEPPPGVWLESSDGAAFTGVVVVDRSQPILMVCVRHEPPPRRWPRTTTWSPDAQLPYWDGGVEQ